MSLLILHAAIRSFFGLAITTFFTQGQITSATAANLPVASTTQMSLADKADARAANRSRRNINASEPLEFAVLPGHRLRKRAMNILSDDAHACSLLRPLV
jgi:hypothetical protein